MRNTAYLLCGDWHLAEELTQTAFTKLYLAWRVDRHAALDQYRCGRSTAERRYPSCRMRGTGARSSAAAARGPDRRSPRGT
jgi:hypothetical protein